MKQFPTNKSLKNVIKYANDNEVSADSEHPRVVVIKFGVGTTDTNTLWLAKQNVRPGYDTKEYATRYKKEALILHFDDARWVAHQLGLLCNRNLPRYPFMLHVNSERLDSCVA